VSALTLRIDQYEYLELIALAAAVGVLAACGNLGFRSLIEFFSWLFRSLEWRALGIRQGTVTEFLIPVILLTGGAGILILDYFFPGGSTRLWIPELPRNGQPGQRAHQAQLDLRQGCGRGTLARRRSFGRTRRTDCTDRRCDRFGDRAIGAALG
jgi:hypothetical protein